jgi:hypothetical protein
MNNYLNYRKDYMNKSILLTSCMLSLSVINAGVLDTTVVDTPQGHKEIKMLCVGDKIYAFNPYNPEEVAAVATIQEKTVDSVVEITTDDNITITVASDQRLFVTHKWVQANQLTLEDVLLKKNLSVVGIINIKHVNQPTTLRYITLDSNPTFFAAQNGVLVHNGPVGATVGALAGGAIVGGTYGALTVGITTGATMLTGPIIGAWIGGVWYTYTSIPAAYAVKVGTVFGGIVGGTATGPV